MQGICTTLQDSCPDVHSAHILGHNGFQSSSLALGAVCAVVQDDPKFKMARRVRSGEQRLRAFLNICGSKRVDEESGGLQPAYRIDGITIRAEFPKAKGDDDDEMGTNIERKQVRSQADLP